MYDLVLSATPDFSPGFTASTYNQYWGFNPASGTPVISIIGQSTPADLDIVTKIKNYINILGTGTYSAYKVFVATEWLNGSAGWFTVSGEIAAAAPGGYDLLTNNLNVTTTCEFGNLNTFPAGTYLANLNFTVKGNNGGVWEVIETVTYQVRLNRMGFYDVLLVPEQIDFVKVLGGAAPVDKTVQLYCASAYSVTCHPKMSLSGGNLVLVQTTANLKKYTGSGNATITCELDTTIEELYVDGEEELQINNILAYNSNSPVYGTTLVFVRFLEDANYKVEPTEMEFLAVKNFVEPATQTLKVIGAGTFTATGPSWLSGDLPETDGEDIMELAIDPISVNNMAPGNYNGIIKVNTSANDINVPVTLKVVENMDTGFKESSLNWTRDRNTISKFYYNDDHFITVDGSTTYSILKSLATKTKSFDFKIGVFDFEASFFLGKTVHLIMPSIKDLSEVSFQLQAAETAPIKYFNLSKTNVAVKFFNRFTKNLVDSLEYNQVAFIPGRKCNRVIENYGGIVDYLENAQRVTVNSKVILNLYQPGSYRVISIYRNEEFYKNIAVKPSQTDVFGSIIRFSDFEKGDVISARFHYSPFQEPSPYVEQTYIVFPEGEQSYHVVWENEHKLLSMMEFTGEYGFGNKYEFIESNVWEDFLEIKKRHETQRSVEFMANTGHILKTQSDQIDSLVNAKRAWIVTPNTGLGKKLYNSIEIVPESKELAKEDSTQQIYSYNVKFTINLSHELENPTF